MTTKLVPATGRWVDFGSTGHTLAWYQSIKAQGVTGGCLDVMTGGWEQDYAFALEAGLQVQFFQGYLTLDWTGGAAEGTARAQQALDAIHAVNAPVGSLCWLDSEAWPDTVTATEAAAWIHAWAAAVTAGHLSPGGYEGANCPLSGEDWWNITTLARYWKSASAVPVIPTRGYQMTQTAVNQDLDGVTVDYDTVQHDLLGSAPWGVVQVPSTTVVSVPPTVATAADVQALSALVRGGFGSLEEDVAAVKAALPKTWSGIVTLG
jgi:hypothetical protein